MDLAAIREGAQRLGLRLTDADHSRIAKLVREAHEGLAAWRFEPSHTVEPSPPFAPKQAHLGVS